MSTIIPDEGLDWWRDKGLEITEVEDEVVYEVAVGDGSASLSNNDTQLDNELYRASDDDSSVAIIQQSGTGEIEARITVNGGTEVPANSDITEFGIWAIDPGNSSTPFSDGGGITDSNDTMLYRELRQASTIQSGAQITFTIPYDITDA